tara:strand:+ start:5893 stop:6924 length:1032 start_codon:yes stop_codon:yes gene_type:complete
MTTLANIRPLSATWWASIPNHVWEAASGVALSSSFFIVGFGDWTMAAFVTGVVWMLAYLGRASLPRWAVASMGIIWGSTVAAVYFADLTTAAIAMAVWVTLMAGVFLSRITLRVLWWTLPAGAIQAVALWYDQITLAEPHRQLGLMSNPNPAAGLMVLMSVLLLTNKRTQWLALPFLAAIPMTGSRAAVLVMAAMLGILLIKRAVTWRKWGAIVSIAALITMPFWGTMEGGLRMQVIPSAIESATERTTLDKQPGWLPEGPQADRNMQHNQALRIAGEAGILAAVAWCGLLLGALWSRRYTPAWYLLITASLLTIFDYYFWMASGVAVLWWIFINVQLKRAEL